MALGLKPFEIVEKNEYPLLTKADHWERVPLSLIAKVQNGFAFKSELFNHNDGMPLIRIRDINNNNTNHRYSGKYEEEYLVNPGDILVGMDGDFNVARWKGPQGLLNQRVCRLLLNNKNYHHRFFFYCLQPYLNAINAETSSVTVKHLSSKTMEEIPLPLPPFNEQRRIVIKIEELFSELDKGIENLKAAQAQLKVYRQAILKHAFEGKLTAKWREENKGNLENAEQLLERIKKNKKMLKPIGRTVSNSLFIKDIAQPPMLPLGWIWVKLDALGYLICGQSPSVSQVNIDKKGILYVTGPEQWNGKEIEATKWTEYPKKIAPTGSIFITVKGAGVGKLFPGTYSAIGRDIYAFCPYHPIASKFVVYALMHSINLVIMNAKGDIPGLTKEHILDHVIGLPSTAEQKQIVLDIERQFSIIEKLQYTINSEIQKAEALRQSILKKAFSGQLVAQDPNDEPASILLERIRSDKKLQKASSKKPLQERGKTHDLFSYCS